MEVTTFDIEGLFLLKPKIFGDDRGYFIESFNKESFNKITGLNIDFIQDNESKSSYGVLRGLHFQKPPFAQSKLVRVIAGEVLDVAVDLRSDSPTFGKYQSVILSGENKNQFFVPKGFAHGFVVLSDTAIFCYKVDGYYAPQSDSGILYNDSFLNIDWKVKPEDLLLSEKDKKNPTFEQYSINPIFK